MGQPAAVAGDRIAGTCTGHQIPGPPAGNPTPAPPMPFSAPLVESLASRVLIGGKPAATAGSAGVNTPPHTGLHAADPFMAPPSQRGTVVQGSSTVLIEGKPAAVTGSQSTICFGLPAQVVGSAANVLIGG